MRIAIGSDHRGVATKAHLVDRLKSAGHQIEDVGPEEAQRVDYPDFASAVGRRVSAGTADRGILVCGTGIGMAIAANKVQGVRAAVCYDEHTARLSREHNDANVLCLSGDLVESDRNAAIVQVWLDTAFEGGRHGRRVAKIGELESR